MSLGRGSEQDGQNDIEGNEDNLTMILALTRKGFEFDEGLTQIADHVGTTFSIPGPKASSAIAYLKGLEGGNPNQNHRDITRVNGLQQKWEEVFNEYNSGTRVPSAITLNMRSMQSTLYKLKNIFSFQIPSIPYVYYK